MHAKVVALMCTVPTIALHFFSLGKSSRQNHTLKYQCSNQSPVTRRSGGETGERLARISSLNRMYFVVVASQFSQ